MKVFILSAPLVIIVLWMKVRAQGNPSVFTAIWIGMTLLLALTGALAWNDEQECTRLASTLLLASFVLLPGLFLDVAMRQSWHPGWVIPLSVFLIPVSVVGTFFIVAGTDQVWGF